MECKGGLAELSSGGLADWNISRMECKGRGRLFDIFVGKYIGIYPEWNVKVKNIIVSYKLDILEYIQNGM